MFPTARQILPLLMTVILGGWGMAVARGAEAPAATDTPCVSGDWRAVSGDLAKRESGALDVTLDDQGVAVLVARVPPGALRHCPIVRLEYGSVPEGLYGWFAWQSGAAGSPPDERQLLLSGKAEWLWLGGDSRWRKGPHEVALVFRGEPGDAITLRSVEALPASTGNRLRTIVYQWTVFTPWSQISINTHPGATGSGGMPLPMPVVAGLLAIALLLLAVTARRRAIPRSRAWQLAGVMSLAAWLLLDLLWQSKLLRQAQQTYQQFAGKTVVERLRAAPDGKLYGSIEAMTTHLGSAATRVFVASTDDYIGMRGAYHLYPRNVYWRRNGPELPDADGLPGAGDFIVVLQPSRIRYDAGVGELRLGKKDALAVELLHDDPTGSLFRVR
jgi:hypothetical protein